MSIVKVSYCQAGEVAALKWLACKGMESVNMLLVLLALEIEVFAAWKTKGKSYRQFIKKININTFVLTLITGNLWFDYV